MECENIEGPFSDHFHDLRQENLGTTKIKKLEPTYCNDPCHKMEQASILNEHLEKNYFSIWGMLLHWDVDFQSLTVACNYPDSCKDIL